MQTRSLGRLQKKSLKHNYYLYVASVSQGSVRKPPTENIPNRLENYFQTKCWKVIPMLLKRIKTTLGQFVWTQFCRLGTKTELTELHMFFMTRSTAFFSSTALVIYRLVFFLIGRQPSESALWRSLEANLQLCWKCAAFQMFF